MLKALLVACTLLLGAVSADYSAAKFAEAVDSFAPAEIALPD